MSHSSRMIWSAAGLCALATVGYTQAPPLNNQWVTFQQQTSTRLLNPNGSVATQVSADTDEKDYATGDLNQDGWIDLVVVRKQPAATLGKRAAQLLLNEAGVLVDRTAQYASTADVAGDMGFLTPTNNRDVQVVDVNMDNLLDVVTATTLSDGDPKHISHPRVYINQGFVGGVWQGLRFENSRFPQLVTTGGLPVAPRFCSVSSEDVTGDGAPDLYFADYDSTETFINEPATWDLNDRLLVNDGNGNFTDSGTARMSATMLQSAFGMASEMEDMNGDGVRDVVKATALGTPQRVSVAYNNPANVGFFNLFQTNLTSPQPYHIDVGDLNQDGKLDLAVGDDGNDHFFFNTGNDGTGRVIWSPLRTFKFAGTTGNDDDGFPGTTLIVDLDNDGWNDIIQADFDVDLPGCSRRCHIYHNQGGTPGSDAINFVEERENAGGTTSGWKGVVGITSSQLTGTYDSAAFDLDNDGDNDIILGRCSGTQVWINQTNQGGVITTFCFGDGSGTLCPCGNASAVGEKVGCLNSFGQGAKLFATGDARVTSDTIVLEGSQMPNASALYFQGTAQATSTFGDGLRCAGGSVVRLGTQTNVGGESQYPSGGDLPVSVKGGVAAGNTHTYQVWYRNSAAFCTPSAFNLSNGLQIVWGP